MSYHDEWLIPDAKKNYQFQNRSRIIPEVKKHS